MQAVRRGKKISARGFLNSPSRIHKFAYPTNDSCRFFSLEQIPKDQSFPHIPKRSQRDRLITKDTYNIPTSVSRSSFKLNEGSSFIVYDEPAKCSSNLEVQRPKRESRNFNKMRSYVQVLTNPTADTQGTCLLLHFDNKRYLLGHVHEGVQRALNQQRIGMNKVSEILLSGKTGWGNFGGTIGMILTVADSVSSSHTADVEQAKATEKRRKASLDKPMSDKQRQKLERDLRLFEEKGGETPVAKPQLTIHGGGNLMHMLATGRRFIFRKGLPIYVNEYDAIVPSKHTLSHPSWSDSNVRVWAIPVRSSATEDTPSRKRSFNDFLEPGSAESAESKDDQGAEEAEERRKKVLRSIVSHMFDSDWRLDALSEKKLGDVQMPAALFVRNTETKKIEKYVGPPQGHKDADPDTKVLVRQPWPGALIKDLPPTQPSVVSMCYIIRCHPQRGKFRPDKAIALNVKPGAHFGQLTAGQTVISQDGKRVTPEQVMDPGKPGGGLFLADVPSVDYLEDLFAQPHWKAPESMEGVGAIVWILGTGVSRDPKFQEFVKQNTQFEHVIASPDHSANRLSIDSAASAAINHCCIDPERYRVPRHNNRGEPLPSEISKIAKVADRGLVLNLEPSIKLDETKIIGPLNTKTVVDRFPNAVMRLGRKAQEAVSSDTHQKELEEQELPSPETEIIALGTGSALPSKYRNVSGTLVRVPGIGSYLLDCGENTLGQLSRLYDSEELNELLKDLRAIWISHLHADHHLGTTSVIKAWYAANREEQQSETRSVQKRIFSSEETSNPTKPLFIFGEQNMIDWIREYSMVEDIGYEHLAPIVVSPVGTTSHGTKPTQLHYDQQPLRFSDKRPHVKKALTTMTGLSDLAAAPVPHCHGAMGVALTFPNGLKISYSGDCRPSQDFVKVGKNSTVLIHEATFDDELQGDAIAKKHSTTSEAIGVGIAMDARRILLTHFSQRYQKIPSMSALDNISLKLESSGGKGEPPPGIEPDAEDDGMQDADTAQEGGSEPAPDNVESSSSKPTQPVDLTVRPRSDLKVAVAYDYMRVKVKDIASLEKFVPAFIKLYDA